MSGDRNPMHMDALAARRTMAGFPVVHGIHALLWSLDRLFRYLRHREPIASIKVTFKKMIHVGDRVELYLTQKDSGNLVLSATVEDTQAINVRIHLGDTTSAEAQSSNGPIFQPTDPIPLEFEEMADRRGRIPFFATLLDDVARMFPSAVDVLGAQRVAGLACSSYLVGMVCPGLHSIFGGLNFSTTPVSECDRNGIEFKVTGSNIHFRLIELAVSGGGWTGSIDAHARPGPVCQAGLPTIAAKVAPGEFSDVSMLVVGGSRGLGELIAKIGAAGGAHVTVTYSVGELDARRVQEEIVSNGWNCEVMRFDVRANARDQLAKIQSIPNEIYYMATPVISKRRNPVFRQEQLDEFIEFYVTGFYNFYKALRSRFGTRHSVFYPSSVFVDTRPAGMTEYTMAKAAGEILCADMQSFERSGSILVRRLPRLATDQTATLFEVGQAESIHVILEIVREVHANRLARTR